MQKKISFIIFLVFVFCIILTPFNSVLAVAEARDWRLSEGMNFQEITSKDLLFSNTEYDSSTALQGFTIAGDYIVYTKWKSSSSNEYNTTIIIADKSGNELGRVSTYNFGHANDMTYNSKTGEVVIPYYDTNDKDHVAKFKIQKSGNNYSITTPEIIDTDYYFGGLDYIKEQDKYVARSGRNILLLDNGFKLIKKITVIKEELHYLTPQAISYYNNHLYVTYYECGHNSSKYQEEYYNAATGRCNLIYVYDLEGNFIKTLYLPKSSFENLEIETVSFFDDGSMLAGFNNQSNDNVYFYKLASSVNPSIKSIEMFSKPTLINYIQNYVDLDLTGAIIKVTYNDQTISYEQSGSSITKKNNGPITANVNCTSDSVKVTGFDNTKLGKNTLTVEYQGKTTTFDVNIVSKQISSISVEKNPTKTSYIQNSENLDLTGGQIKVTYNDKSTDTIDMTNENVKATGFNNSNVGKNTITLEYQGKTTTFDVNITENNVSSISVEKNPTKMNYIHESENLDLTGGQIKVVYSDSHTDIVDMTNEAVKATGFDNSSVGKNTITLEYQGKTTTFDVNIISKQVKEIKIEQLPTKTKYIQNYENLDLTGGKIKVTYNDNSSDTLSMTIKTIEVTGFDNSKLGKNTITVKYLGREMNFDVEIISKQATEISIEKPPTKTSYMQNYEKLDLTGGQIKVKYNDNSTDTLSMTNKEVKATGFDNSKLGKNTVTLEYQGKTATFDVDIIENTVSRIAIDKLPTKTNYIQGYENLDLTGGTLKVIFKDETSETVELTNENVEVTGFDNSKVGKNTLTVKYFGKETTFDVEILTKQVTKVELKTKPTKTNYIQGYEKLDLTGGELKVTYIDKSTDTISMTNEAVKATGFDNSKIGKNTVTVEYNGGKVSFDVEIIAKQKLKIEVTKQPKVRYNPNTGEMYLTEGELTVYYTDNTQETVSMTDDRVSISGLEGKLGKQKMKVDYEGMTTEIEVDVVEAGQTEDMDPTIAKGKLPLTGIGSAVIVIVSIGIAIILFKKYHNLNDVK